MEKAIFFEEIYPLPGVAEEGGLERTCAWLSELGLDGFQFSEDDFVIAGEARVLSALQKTGLRASVIHTLPRLLAADEATFREGVAHAMKALELCVRAGCHRLMVVPLPRSDVQGEADLPRARARMIEGLKLLLPEAAARGVTLYFENFSTKKLPYGTVEDAEEISDAVPEAVYCFDTGNYLCTRTDVHAAWSRLAPLAGLLHVKNFADSAVPTGVQCDDGGYMQGLALGRGDFDVRRFLAVAKETTHADICVLEHNASITHADVEESVRVLREFF